MMKVVLLGLLCSLLHFCGKGTTFCYSDAQILIISFLFVFKETGYLIGIIFQFIYLIGVFCGGFYGRIQSYFEILAIMLICVNWRLLTLAMNLSAVWYLIKCLYTPA